MCGATVFPRRGPYNDAMIDEFARTDRVDTSPVSMTDGGPWGGGDGESSGDGDGGGKGNPWTQPPRKRRGGLRAAGQPSLDELIRISRARFGGGMPRGGRPIWGYALAAFVALWLVTTSIHQIDPQERGVITRFGRYAGTLDAGIGLTLPAPIDVVTRVNVDQSSFDVPESGGRNLVMTGDKNVVDMAYTVRWSVRDPQLFLFELADPEDTIRAVAQSAMREETGRVTLDEAIGPLRSQIEARVAARLQSVLDRYHVGVAIQGIAIKQADPPQQVAEAFKDVSAAQQQAQAYLTNARAYAEQVGANAQAAAASFDKVYEAYKLAPEVTRKRMYYETMEAVLAKSNKVVVDTPGAAPYLPLPMPQAKPLPTPEAPAATTPAAPATGGGQ
jgi:membrane protease subunit HflK